MDTPTDTNTCILSCVRIHICTCFLYTRSPKYMYMHPYTHVYPGIDIFSLLQNDMYPEQRRTYNNTKLQGNCGHKKSQPLTHMKQCLHHVCAVRLWWTDRVTHRNRAGGDKSAVALCSLLKPSDCAHRRAPREHGGGKEAVQPRSSTVKMVLLLRDSELGWGRETGVTGPCGTRQAACRVTVSKVSSASWH